MRHKVESKTLKHQHVSLEIQAFNNYFARLLY